MWRHKQAGLPRGVMVLGLVSLFMDISSEMIHALLPVFLVTVLGSSATMVGMIEGLGEGLALIVRVFSGTLSDRLGRRKPLILLGYLLGALSKPLFAIATASGMVMWARSLDRLGKGIRGAPRDALIADLTPQPIRGAAYGLRQSLDSLGAFIGPLLAMLLMALTLNDFRQVFWLAIIPGLLAVGLIIFFVREPHRSTTGTGPRLTPVQARQLPAYYWLILLVAVLFSFARFSEAFMILRAQALGLELYLIPAVLMVMSLCYALGAYPVGHWSDRLGRRGFLTLGLLLLLLADLVLAGATELWQVFLGAALWGLHMAFTQGIFAALVADSAGQQVRGTAFGVFGLATGVALILSSILAGWLWDHHGAAMTFYAGAGFCLLTLLGFQLLARRLITKV